MPWRQVAERQDGVVGRRQLGEAGLVDHDIRRLVRRRDLTPVAPGVLVVHSGAPTWRQRAWAAVLYAHPAALAGTSALHVAGAQRTAPAQIEVAIDHSRRVRPQPGLVVRRIVGLEPRVLWNTSPPRLRPEHAVVDVAASAPDELAAIAVLVDAVQARTTTADRVRRVLAARSRLPRRAFLTRVAADLAEGTHSVLEHRYLTHVERRHRLPTGERQATIPGSVAVHDVVYRGARVVVELDGRAYHSVARARFADLERDAEALVRDHVTIRLGWAQVVGDPCGSARRLSVVLAARGWDGGLYRCPSC